jgi:hypothetical protein
VLAAMNAFHPSLVGDVGQQRVEEHKVCARFDREMQYSVLACFCLAGCNGHGPARVNDDNAAGLDRLVRKFLLFLVE